MRARDRGGGADEEEVPRNVIESLLENAGTPTIPGTCGSQIERFPNQA